MLKTKIRKRLCTVFAGFLSSIMLLALLPLSASAVEYTTLASINKGIQDPTDVAVSASGNIYAVDSLGKIILIYNDKYHLTAKVSSVAHPTTVAVSGDTLFVGDTSTRSVKMLSSSGAVIGDLKKSGITAKFKLPRNIAVDANGSVYVVDQFSNSIEVFDASGNYSYTISGLSMPQDAVAVGNELFIIEQSLQNTSTTGGTFDSSVMRMSRIQIFDLVTQTFVADATRTFPANGNDTTLGQFINLQAIAADSQNNLYINDSFLNTLYKYDINGQFLGVIDEPLKTPMGSTVSPDGRLVVSSSDQGMLKVLGVDYIAGAYTWLNDAPIVDAGADQTVSEGDAFVLDASGSFDEDGISNYRWTQLSGPPVLPANPFDTDTAQVALTAPGIDPMGWCCRHPGYGE
jgi:sugar lactone lactonase YvrE